MATHRMIKHLVSALLCFYSAALFAYGCDSETCAEGRIFERGDLEAVKRVFGGKGSKAPFQESILAAINSGNVELVKYLDSRGWLKCTKTEEWDCDYVGYAAHSPAHDGSVQMLTFFLARGFPVTLTALRSAATWGNLQAIDLFCKRGAKVDEKFSYEVHGVKYSGTILDEQKKYIDRALAYGKDPLSDSRVFAGQAKVIEYLEGGRCATARTQSAYVDSYMAEVRALRRGDVKVAKDLIAQRKASADDPRVQTYELYEAIASGNLELLQYLKSAGWLERCRSTSYCFPLHIAAQTATDIKVLDFLISERFGVDAYNHESEGNYESGGTPLHYAALSGNLDNVKLLCEKGADFRKNILYTYPPETLLYGLRIPYGNLWCELNEVRSAAARELCSELGEFGAPQCMPGSTCMDVKFPPVGLEKDVQRIVALNEVFQYLKNGQCRSAQTEVCRAPTGKTGTVVGEKVNVREAPSLNGGIIGTLDFGAKVKVIEQSKSCETVAGRFGRWIKVGMYYGREAEGGKGWVFDSIIDYSASDRE